MKHIHRSAIALTALALLPFASAAPAHADNALEFSSSIGILEFNDTSMGWSFTTNQTITVDALSALTVDSTGNEVRLYNSAGTTLASQTIFNTDPTQGSPEPFFTHTITPVVLAAGQTYYVVEDVSARVGSDMQASGVTTNAAINYGGPVSASSKGMNPLSDFYGPGGSPGYFGPNFDIGTPRTTSVPEPGTYALLGSLGLTGIGLLRRRRKLTR